MSGAQHTAAPWDLSAPGDYGDYGGKCSVVCGDDTRIAVVLGVQAEDQANARLIAAAPDLLAALERAVFRLEFTADIVAEAFPFSTGKLRQEASDARAAIAKATGA